MAIRYFSLTAIFFLAIMLAACGGGSGGSTNVGTPVVVPTCAAFTDSFGRAVSCEEMSRLSGVELGYSEAGGDGASGAGDGGADGTGADGAPIANADLQFTDINGKTVRTRTDANGYYRINLRGLMAPLVATVLRDDKPWKSMLVQDIVKAPANRQFYTINLTGLTDVVASEVVKKAGLSGGADALTPAAVKAQKESVPAIVANLNNSIAAQLVKAGINPATFNPLTMPFVTNKAGYDLVLESVVITRTASGTQVSIPASTSAIAGTYSGTYTGLDRGQITLQISSAGVVSGTAVSSIFPQDGAGVVTGTVNSITRSLNCTIFNAQVGGRATLIGSIDANGVITGLIDNGVGNTFAVSLTKVQ
jgi:hypothetical protein